LRLTLFIYIILILNNFLKTIIFLVITSNASGGVLCFSKSLFKNLTKLNNSNNNNG